MCCSGREGVAVSLTNGCSQSGVWGEREREKGEGDGEEGNEVIMYYGEVEFRKCNFGSFSFHIPHMAVITTQTVAPSTSLYLPPPLSPIQDFMSLFTAASSWIERTSLC